ncbi:hydroxycarboxylic acid receptor 3-like [Astyanax mexicanus]|uniref:Hydroxycarboxylic acid receptor 3-like n=1 Tax=Astyanax mexicanus TaxID=7994 RepID=A0A8T2LW19_ASTMX|nr:hydroxycarboxylic acid receptor 3-like [Astyanax mexicanus]
MPFNDTAHRCYLAPQPLVSSILPPMLIIELLLGLPGNLMALWVFSRHLRSWKPNVVLLFNLAVADLMLLVSLPYQIHYHLQQENWVFGHFWCRFNLFMLAINRSASIGFMTAVAVDRYFKVVHVHHKINFISSRTVAGIACFIWIVVILLRLPLLTSDLMIIKNNKSVCRSFNYYKNPPPGILFHYIVYLSEFFLSFIVLLFCSLRIYCFLGRRQIATRTKMRPAMKIVLVIIGIFIVCFFPGVATGLSALYLSTLGKEYYDGLRLNGQLFVLALGLTYLNSALDPIVYGFCSSMFRDALRQSIHRLGSVKGSKKYFLQPLKGRGNAKIRTVK